MDLPSPCALGIRFDGERHGRHPGQVAADITPDHVRFSTTPGAITSARTITFTVNDGDGGTSAAATVTVSDANDAPTNIDLSSTSFPENAVANTIVGNLTTTDADAGQTYSYALVAGADDDDNGLFNIDDTNKQLRATNSFNFESGATYKVRIQTTDNGSPPLSFSKAFTITVTNVNEAPTGGPNSKTIVEDTPYTFVSGDFTFTDPDAGNTLNQVRIVSGPTAGTLTVNNVPVTANQVVLVSNFTNFVFTPAADATDSHSTRRSSTRVTRAKALRRDDAAARSTSRPPTTPRRSTDGTLTAVAEDTTRARSAQFEDVRRQFADVDADDFAGIAVIANTANAGTEGVWQYSANNGTNWFPIGTVSIAAALGGAAYLVRFVPDGQPTTRKARRRSVGFGTTWRSVVRPQHVCVGRRRPGHDDQVRGDASLATVAPRPRHPGAVERDRSIARWLRSPALLRRRGARR